MANIKAEVLSSILEGAKNAKSIEGKPNIYTPDEYNKIAAQNRALGLLGDTSGYLESHIQPGQVEFDPNTGMLKKVARNEPKMLDLNAYTANRYMKEVVLPINAKKVGRDAGTYIIVVLGNAIVSAINNTQELPPTVKAYRFKQVEKVTYKDPNATTSEEEVIDLDAMSAEETEKKAEEIAANLEKVVTKTWEYCGAEFIKDEVAYKMVDQLNPEAVLKLRSMIDENPNPRLGDNVYGDSLDDIA